MDTTIKFTGWSDGFDKVALNILLRQYADFGLKQAKNITDAILNNEYVEVSETEALKLSKPKGKPAL